jgi:hypothetical protein
VLAVEPRLLIPRDILTDKPVYVNITVFRRKNDGDIEQIRLRAPCLVPEVNSIDKVHIDDDRYWRIEIKNKDALIKCLSKEHGYLSVKQKAHSSNNQLVQNIENYILENMAQGVMKCRKSSALTECVKEDRVVQYSALNELLTKSHKADLRFRCLILEQLRLAITLSKDSNLADKINLLKPLVGEYGDEIRKDQSEKGWLEYISGRKDWTNSSANVAYFIALQGLKCSDVDDDLVQSLIELDID